LHKGKKAAVRAVDAKTAQLDFAHVASQILADRCHDLANTMTYTTTSRGFGMTILELSRKLLT